MLAWGVLEWFLDGVCCPRSETLPISTCKDFSPSKNGCFFFFFFFQNFCKLELWEISKFLGFFYLKNGRVYKYFASFFFVCFVFFVCEMGPSSKNILTKPKWVSCLKDFWWKSIPIWAAHYSLYACMSTPLAGTASLPKASKCDFHLIQYSILTGNIV